ncbi:YcxB family protein [Zophobihabitans entericus]|uniref:YcxB family protein n=1 Tax=Zophobihabitans entericus TaxID=1635327 RepID=A0A6G9IBI9_9GAMM|nr:YcxB family protein [Zophobihabitans entericus]QIQ21197.1 YcxB family protein [Zophobihabitans entericus]
MKITYRISESDYVGSIKQHFRLTSKHKIMYGAITVVALLLIVWGEGFMYPLAGALLAMVLVSFIIREVIYPWVARRDYKKYPGMKDVFTIEPTNDGFAMTSAHSTFMLTWDIILKWQEDDKYIRIYTMPKLFFTIPKSFIVADGYEPSVITDHLQSRFSQSK